MTTDDYYAVPYLRGCGELITDRTEVDDSDPELVKITVWAYKPEEEE